MYDSRREIIEMLRATPDTLAGLLRGVSVEEARRARGGDEDWSVVEVVAHLRDSEAFMLERLRALRDEPEPLIGGFDQLAWARERNYAASDLHDTCAAFTRLRRQHVDELAALTADLWDRVGQHRDHGAVTITNHTLHVAWHDAVHLAQIARQLGQALVLPQ